MIKIFLNLFVALLGFGCGVKDKPLPPQEEPTIGYGRPRYKGAHEDLKKVEVEEDEDDKQKEESP